MKTTHSRWLFPVLLVLILLAAACSAPGVNRLENFSLSKEPLTGKFVWHDLITDDVERVKRFSSGLFGWTFEDTTRPNGGDYTLIMNGDRFVGGIVQLDDPSGVEYSRWLGYLSVDDVDIAAGFTEAQGGRAADRQLDLLRGGGRDVVPAVLLLRHGHDQNGPLRLLQLDAAHGVHHHLQQQNIVVLKFQFPIGRSLKIYQVPLFQLT